MKSILLFVLLACFSSLCYASVDGIIGINLDSVPCLNYGDCTLNNLTVVNLINATYSTVYINASLVVGEHWVNETGDTMTGDLNTSGEMISSGYRYYNESNTGYGNLGCIENYCFHYVDGGITRHLIGADASNYIDIRKGIYYYKASSGWEYAVNSLYFYPYYDLGLSQGRDDRRYLKVNAQQLHNVTNITIDSGSNLSIGGGNVTLFKDDLVGDTEDGKKFCINRKANEGDKHYCFDIGQFSVGRVRGNLNWIYYTVDSMGANFQGTPGLNIGRFRNSAGLPFNIFGKMTEKGSDAMVQFRINDTSNTFRLDRGDSYVENFEIRMPVKVDNLTTKSKLTFNDTTDSGIMEWFGSLNLLRWTKELQIGDDEKQNHGINTLPSSTIGINEDFNISGTGNRHGRYTLVSRADNNPSTTAYGNYIDLDRSGNHLLGFSTINSYGNYIDIADTSVYNGVPLSNSYNYGTLNSLGFSGTITNVQNYNQYGTYNTLNGNMGGATGSFKVGTTNVFGGSSQDITGIYNYVEITASPTGVSIGTDNRVTATTGTTNIGGRFEASGGDENFAIQTVAGEAWFSDNLTVKGDITGNQIYAEMWGNDLRGNIGSQDVYANISDYNGTLLNGFSYDNGTLTPLIDGLYHITSQYSFSGTANNEYHLTIGIDGTKQDNCHSERVIGTGGDVGSSSITCFISITVGQDVSAMIENADSAGNPNIHDVNVNLIRIGDTI